MTDKEVVQDITYRLKVSKQIEKLEEDVREGVYDDSPLLDLVFFYRREIEQLEKENEMLLERLKESK